MGIRTLGKVRFLKGRNAAGPQISTTDLMAAAGSGMNNRI
jgi:hypothetical protein